MNKRNLEAENAVLGFEVAFETLGEGGSFPSRVETRKLRLDVGCGSKPTGDVNVDFFVRGWNSQEGDQKRGELLNPKLIPNFVVADAEHLPFKDDVFEVVFSSHVIEHVAKPFLMYSEMRRVASRKVIVRCPHRQGSGAKRPFHVNYLDEDWFKLAANRLGSQSLQFVRAYEFLCSSRVHCPKRLEKSIPWRVFKRFERKFGIKRPFEFEAWLTKTEVSEKSSELRFFVIYNSLTTLKNCFLASPYILSYYFNGPFNDPFNPDGGLTNISLHENLSGEPLPIIFNRYIESYLKNNKDDCWLVFCHQDFFLKEDLRLIIKNKNINAIYGVIGCRTSTSNLFGRIMQRDGSFNGDSIDVDTPVQTLDEMCLIVHSSLFRNGGLRFDERFKFHFYGADLCMQAYVSGFDVYAIQVNCQHKSRTLTGDVTSKEYFAQLKLFADKWCIHLPIKTTTRLVTAKDVSA